MPSKLEKVLNHWVLLAVNIAIIFATEFSGSFFMEKGFIHLIAVFFVILGISRIFVHYNTYDRYLKLLISGGSGALIVFAGSHLVEFLGFMYFHVYEDAVFVSVIYFYIASILAMVVGAEYFLRALEKNNTVFIWILGALTLFFLFLPVFVFTEKFKVSLEPDEISVYIHALLVLSASIFCMNRLIKIKKHVSMMAGFINYFIAAFVLITISALQYVFYDGLENIGVTNLQVIYVSHFLFYGALSLMFLAFVRLAHLGGIYAIMERTKHGADI